MLFILLSDLYLHCLWHYIELVVTWWRPPGPVDSQNPHPEPHRIGAICLMARRGVKRISGLIYEETRGVLKFFSLSVWSSYLCGLPLVDPCQLLFLWWSELWVIHTTWYIYSNITWHLELIKGIPWPWEVNQETLFLLSSVLHVISTSQINYW